MKNSKSMIMVLLLLAAMFFGYMTLFSENPDEAMTEEGTEGEIATQNAGDELVKLLDQLRAIRMDGKIFASPSFRMLRDETRQVVDEPVGRNNPFAAIGAGGSPAPVASATTSAARR